VIYRNTDRSLFVIGITNSTCRCPQLEVIFNTFHITAVIRDGQSKRFACDLWRDSRRDSGSWISLNHFWITSYFEVWPPRFCRRNNWAEEIYLLIRILRSANRIEWITIQQFESPPGVIQWFKNDSPFPQFKDGFSHRNHVLNHVVNHRRIAYSDRPYYWTVCMLKGYKLIRWVP